MEEKKEENSPTKWEKYAKGKKPSMKRRCSQNDYLDRGIYMITIAIEGRRPLLGRLVGDPDIKEGENAPHIILSPLGEAVKACWQAIPQYHPQIEVIKLCVMPDHIHGVLFVHERMEKHLGHVIWGFKAGTAKAARELRILPNKTAEIPQPTKPAQKETTPVQFTAVSPQSPSTTPSHPTHGQLWEPNYNDRILRGRGQYARMLAYLDDNPRRLLIKRQHPEYLTQLGTLTVVHLPMQAMGNRFLLDNPIKLQIQCSRHMTQEEIEHQKTTMLFRARNEGAILVSPCISPGEQQIATAAMAESIPLIVLLLKGFPPLFKPQPRYLEACTKGRLLMLAPFPYQNEKLENMRARCLELNHITAEICQ